MYRQLQDRVSLGISAQANFAPAKLSAPQERGRSQNAQGQWVKK